MPSQGEDGIPLASAPDGRGYRLFELPPELESILDSPNVPVLHLQQPESSTSATLSVDGGSTTYTLQQKNTSNALILLTPTSATEAPLSAEDPAATGGMTAIATLHETIELAAQTSTQVQKPKGKWHERFGKTR